MLGQARDHGSHEHPHGHTSLGEGVDGREAACGLGGTRLQQAGERAVEGRDREEHGRSVVAG
jgi:hypothetical protein